MPLPPELMPAVPHITFGIFNLAIPNLIMGFAMIGIFVVAAWARLPRFFEPKSEV
jgi:hypothetical protein